MKKIALTFSIIWLCLNSFTQSNHVYTSLDETKNVHPDSVIVLDLSKDKLTEIPLEILAFNSLKELRLTKNKLKSLPPNFYLPSLEIIDLSKNDFYDFPVALLKMKQLKEIYMGKNNLATLPEDIDSLKSLEILELWFNPVEDLPENLVNLKKLKFLDLRGYNYNEAFQKKWHSAMPWCTFEFDLACNCAY